MIALTDRALLREHCFVAGQWIDADDGARFAVTNPATGAIVAHVPECGAAETRRAIAAATAAFADWRRQTAGHRAGLLRRWFELIVANREDLARLMTAEQGKPLAEARGEIDYAASYVEWYAEEARRLYGDIIPAPASDRRLVVTKEPVGVCAAITPWNFPAAMITRKVAPALAAGCTMIVKPAEQTPLSALALAALAERAGIPAGVFQVITGAPAAIGGVLTSDANVRKLSFTGSTEIGRLLIGQCAGTVKRLSMELGGNAPFIVFDDADVEAAVAGAVASKYRNAGQTCVCSNRFLIQDAIHDRFVARLVEVVSALKLGDGMAEGVEQGPLIDAAALAKVERLVADARAAGASVALGGARHALGGTYFQPTVLTGVRPDMAVAVEEIFGPVAALIRFTDEAEAVRLANDSEFGLAAYLFTRDHARVWRIGEALEYGMVGINTGLISTAVAPFGGVKQSGFGREGSHHGINDYVELKYLCMGGI